jgi:hypothetical protein
MRDFHYTLNVLVKAYLNDTLEHANCSACAVGNIVADSLRTNDFHVMSPTVYDWNNVTAGFGWAAVFCTVAKDKQLVFPIQYGNDAKKQIDSTGYTWRELARIEKAFESCNPDYANIKDVDAAMFNGLCAVVDVLADIHQIDLSVREEAKKLFVKV